MFEKEATYKQPKTQMEVCRMESGKLLPTLHVIASYFDSRI